MGEFDYGNQLDIGKQCWKTILETYGIAFHREESGKTIEFCWVGIRLLGQEPRPKPIHILTKMTIAVETHPFFKMWTFINQWYLLNSTIPFFILV